MPAESLVVIALALAIGALVKGISGLGLPLVAVPVMAGFLGVEHAVTIIVVPGFLVQGWLVWVHRRELPALPPLRGMLVAAVVGVAAGTWVLSVASERWLTLLLASWLGLYLATLALRLDPWQPLRRSGRAGPLVVWLGGVVQGATGISGPIVASYMHALKLQKGAYILCSNLIFQVYMAAQLASLSGLGLMTWTRLQEGLLACIPVAIVLPLAIRISRRISQAAFNRVVVSLLAVMELRLILRVVEQFG